MNDPKHPETELVGHEYDGIRELDNPTPRWWQIAFALTIVFGTGYWLYYQVLGGPTLQQELDSDLAVLDKLQKAALASGEIDPARLNAMVKDPVTLAQGHVIFEARCVACHGAQGQGLVGPNLTDDYWIHGDGSASAILTVVKNGVLDKGMPPWGTMLKPEEVIQAAV